MRLPDPLKIKHIVLSTTISSAIAQDKGRRERQEDSVFANDNDTFVIADGIGGLPHGDQASQETVKSAVWSIQLAKQRYAYWKDKKLLSSRISRSVNQTVRTLKKRLDINESFGSTMSLLVFSDRCFYVYHVGDSAIFLLRDKQLRRLTPIDRANENSIIKAIGISDQAPELSFYKDTLRSEDLFVLTTDGVWDYIEEQEMVAILTTTAEDKARLLIDRAKINGSTDNMTTCLVSYMIY